MAFSPEMHELSDNSIKTIIGYLRGFSTHNQPNWDDYLRFAKYRYNSTILCAGTETPFELDVGYAPPLPLDLIGDYPWPQANESWENYTTLWIR